MLDQANASLPLATMCEEFVGLLTMLPCNRPVNEPEWEKGKATSWRDYLCGLRKDCGPKAAAHLQAKSHSQVLSNA